jgi:hypothetical protein
VRKDVARVFAENNFRKNTACNLDRAIAQSCNLGSIWASAYESCCITVAPSEIAWLYMAKIISWTYLLSWMRSEHQRGGVTPRLTFPQNSTERA